MLILTCLPAIVASSGDSTPVEPLDAPDSSIPTPRPTVSTPRPTVSTPRPTVSTPSPTDLWNTWNLDMHKQRSAYNQSRLNAELAQAELMEERLGGLEMETQLLKSWIDENSLEFWAEVERINESVAEQQASFADLMYFLEYEKQMKALDAYSLALDYIQDLANVEGEVMALRVRAQADRNEWAFRFQEMMISAELQTQRCDQEISRLDTQVAFLMDIMQDIATAANINLTTRLADKLGVDVSKVYEDLSK